MTGIEAEFLEDGAQSAADVADRLVAFIARGHGDDRRRDLRLRRARGRDRADRRRAGGGGGARRRRCASRSTRNAKPKATHNPPMVCDPETIDGLEVPTRGVHDQGALMHHKYVVRDARRRVDRLHELDGRRVLARGERDRPRLVARRRRRLHAQLRAALDQGAPRVERRRGCDAHARSRRRRATAVLSSRSVARAPGRGAHRLRAPSRADPLPRHHVGRGARHARGDRGTRLVRPGGRVRRDPDARGGRAMADVATEPLEDRRVGRDPSAPLGQGLDAVERRGRCARLHAREGRGGRRRGA